MGRMIDRRRVMGGESLPYDAEIEYLESTGTQYIDTGIPYIQGDTIELNGRFLRLFHDYGILTMIPWNSPSNTRFMFAVINRKEKCFGMSYNYNPGDSNTGTINNPIFDDNFHTWHYEGKSLSIDNNIYLTNSGDYNQGGGTLCLSRGALSICPTSIKYYKQYRNNALIRDFIPVRVGQVGYMYDRVSKQLFGNSGTGAFILGPDK